MENFYLVIDVWKVRRRPTQHAGVVQTVDPVLDQFVMRFVPEEDSPQDLLEAVYEILSEVGAV